jgi:hypothetical protein
MTETVMNAAGMMIFVDRPSTPVCAASSVRRAASQNSRRVSGRSAPSSSTTTGRRHLDYVQQFGAIVPTPVIATLLGVGARPGSCAF